MILQKLLVKSIAKCIFGTKRQKMQVYCLLMSTYSLMLCTL